MGTAMAIDDDIIERIRARLQRLAPSFVSIADDGARHAGHTGARGGGYYDLHIVSGLFTDQPLIVRHRMIHDALGDLMNGEIHALAIRAQTAIEANQLT
jgi:BolA protein